MPPVRTERPTRAPRIDEVADLITPMAVRVAASLRLAEHIQEGTDTIDALVAVTGTHPPSLAALVGHLVAVDVFSQDAEGRLGLTVLGRQLRLAQTYLDVEHSVGRSELSLVRLLGSVRSGEPAYPVQFGRTFWADLVAEPQLKSSFDTMTDAHLRKELPLLATAYDWSSATHLIDLGAGNAALLIELLTSYEQLTGTILEQPGNTEVAIRNLAAAGLATRCEVIEGSFFEPLTGLPAGSYVLSGVLHDWNDERTSTILRRCREALAPAESLLVIDSFVDDEYDTRMNLLMLALFGGRQRTVPEMVQLAADEGLQLVQSSRLRHKWLLRFRAAPSHSLG